MLGASILGLALAAGQRGTVLHRLVLAPSGLTSASVRGAAVPPCSCTRGCDRTLSVSPPDGLSAARLRCAVLGLNEELVHAPWDTRAACSVHPIRHCIETGSHAFRSTLSMHPLDGPCSDGCPARTLPVGKHVARSVPPGYGLSAC